MSTPIRRAIYGKRAGSDLPPLLGTAGSGYTQSIYHDQAPDDAGFPLIIFSKSSGVPSETFGSYRNPPAPSPPGAGPYAPGVLENEVWLIKAIARAGDMPGENRSASDRAEWIASRVKDLLNDAKLSITGIPDDPVSGFPPQPLYLRRESDVEYAELSDGVVYRHCGSLYRIVTTSP